MPSSRIRFTLHGRALGDATEAQIVARLRACRDADLMRRFDIYLEGPPNDAVLVFEGTLTQDEIDHVRRKPHQSYTLYLAGPITWYAADLFELAAPPGFAAPRVRFYDEPRRRR